MSADDRTGGGSDDQRMRRLRVVLVALVIAAVPAATTLGATSRAPRAAIVAAFAKAVYHYPSPEKIRVSVSLRSARDHDWSLVTGYYGKRGLWAAWVRRTASGRQRVEIFRTRNFDPGTRPPCDIRPAFSEPSC